MSKRSGIIPDIFSQDVNIIQNADSSIVADRGVTVAV